jgi:hypothetical protein
MELYSHWNTGSVNLCKFFVISVLFVNCIENYHDQNEIQFVTNKGPATSTATLVATSAPCQMQTPLTGDYDQNIGTSVTKSNRHTPQTPLTVPSGSQAHGQL